MVTVLKKKKTNKINDIHAYIQVTHYTCNGGKSWGFLLGIMNEKNLREESIYPPLFGKRSGYHHAPSEQAVQYMCNFIIQAVPTHHDDHKISSHTPDPPLLAESPIILAPLPLPYHERDVHHVPLLFQLLYGTTPIDRHHGR